MGSIRLAEKAIPDTVHLMVRGRFLARIETFGLDTEEPWALDALRLLFNVPRAYQMLADAWDQRYPGTKKALERLVEMGFVAYQGPVVVDTRTGEDAERPTRAVRRFRTTSKGHKFALAMAEDIRVLEDTFPHVKNTNVKGVVRLLQAFDLDDSHAKYGLSVGHATDISGLPERNGRWWVERLVEKGILRELSERYADTREVVPAHWRVTRALRNQLRDVLDAFEDVPETMKLEFRLGRTRFLKDVDPARLGISGATDFDHDIECQRVLAALVRSELWVKDGIFTVEPRINLSIDTTKTPWEFDAAADGTLFYQPDAMLKDVAKKDVFSGKDGDEKDRTVISVLEYERYQTRRDAWNHIERFLGYLHTRTFPFESAVLRFVVDSEARERSYVKLISSFATHAEDHPELVPDNDRILLAVSSVPRLLRSRDPMDLRGWHRVELHKKRADRADTGSRPVLHPSEASPYAEYFSRRTS